MSALKSKPDEGLFHCSRCDQLKEKDQFYKCKSAKYGVGNMCKSCTYEHGKKWYAENKERAAKTKAKSAAKETSKATQKKWREENKEYIYENLKIWREENKEKFEAICKRYRLNNADKVAARNRSRDSVKRSAKVRWADQSKITDLYIQARKLTADTGVQHHVDHIIPIKGKGVCGLHVETNLQILTQKENLMKHNKFECEV